MSGFRFLVRTNAVLGNALADSKTPVGLMAVRLSPLLPRSSARITTDQRVAALGVSSQQDWFVAETSSEIDPATAWDECHNQFTAALGLAATSGVSYAEPDWPQSWIPEDKVATQFVSPFGAADCTEQRWMDSAAIPHGARPDWHLDDDRSGLRTARNSVHLNGSRRVRIGHLDTGYDPTHKLLPLNLRSDLARNFVNGENPSSAADPFVTGPLKSPGHGTGTICILAGSKLEGLTYDDENTGDFLGGAPEAEVIPVRIAKSVVLFYTSAFASGLDYLTAPGATDTPGGFACDVVTMSMGGLASAAWTEIVNRAYELGICIFAAAGNNFAGVPTHNIVYPARYNRVTAVCGAMFDRKPYYNLPLDVMEGNWGPASKMATAIATYTPNIPWAVWGCPKAYRWNGQGTSAATPQAAAAAALYIQKNLAGIGNYSQPWMKVEAVRKALFDSARRNTPPGEFDQYFGNGTINAAAALGIAPAQEAALTMQPRDSATFPFLRVITGLGIAGIAPERIEMLELEVVQLSQQSKELQEIIPDPHVPATQIDEKQRKQFVEAVLASPMASRMLKSFLQASQAGNAVPGGPPTLPQKPMVPGPAPVRLPLAAISPQPAFRKLRGYVFDPSLATELQNVGISQATYQIPWEPDLEPGPKGEYVEVVDYDYNRATTYEPVDLNDKSALAQDGLPLSEGNAKFHQQMVYTVAMNTIRHFELALGRRALWADQDGNFVRRLTLNPHAMNDQNAFYSPERKGVLFGYFNAQAPDPAKQYPGGIVYTCLSHDIVAHEVTHALLDGLHKGFREPSNPDVLAFHEAFADIVALFQQFSNPDVLRNQLAAVRGDLYMESLLGNLAKQFGEATTGHSALRSAYLAFEKDATTHQVNPQPTVLQSLTEPHARGAVLLAAVYGAFLEIYRNRTADLLRIATSGTGVLPLGALHPDLINRLCIEAGKSAEHVLRMCIRALDYCPPVDITFGDYLRAIITADHDIVPDDDRHYRIAFVESFRKWGIYPPKLPTLSVETLLWQPPQLDNRDVLSSVFRFLSDFVAQNGYASSREELFQQTQRCKQGLREKLDKILDDPAASAKLASALGFSGSVENYEIVRLRVAQKVSPDGDSMPQVIVAITQQLETAPGDDPSRSLPFRGGATLVADLRRSDIRYCITKSLDNKERQDRQLNYTKQLQDSGAYFPREPFALLHAVKQAGKRSTP